VPVVHTPVGLVEAYRLMELELLPGPLELALALVPQTPLPVAGVVKMGVGVVKLKLARAAASAAAMVALLKVRKVGVVDDCACATSCTPKVRVAQTAAKAMKRLDMVRNFQIK
jgi:hypothetical protein